MDRILTQISPRPIHDMRVLIRATDDQRSIN